MNNKFIIDFKIKDNNVTITYNDGLKKSFPYTKTNRENLLNFLKNEETIYTKRKNSLAYRKIIVVTLTFTDIFLTILSYIKLNSILLKIFISLLSFFTLKLLFFINGYLTNDIYEINIMLSYIHKDNFLREEYLYAKHQKIIDFKKVKELKEELGYNYKPKNNKQKDNKENKLPIVMDNQKVLKRK